jgi:Fe2+ or Zn2+ uptake regulation protein
MSSDIKEILKKNQLSVTASREKILNLFLEQPGALAHGDIEKRAGEKFDRVYCLPHPANLCRERDHSYYTYRR